MTKRVRGPVRSHRRPGTRAPSERPATRRRTTASEATPAPPTSQLEAAEEIAEDVVEERPASAADELRRVARPTHARHRVKAGSLLAARAATEYVYVAKDMRRILVVTAVLIATLFALWLAIVILRVIELPFY